MKKLSFLTLVFMLLAACNVDPDEITYSEVRIENVDEDVKQFVKEMEILEDGTGNGIYLHNKSEKSYYLYLSQEFLDSGNAFGEFDIKNDGTSFSIYLNEESSKDNEPESYKLYKIKLDKEYDTVRVFKDGKETHFHIISG